MQRIFARLTFSGIILHEKKEERYVSFVQVYFKENKEDKEIKCEQTFSIALRYNLFINRHSRIIYIFT